MMQSGFRAVHRACVLGRGLQHTRQYTAGALPQSPWIPRILKNQKEAAAVNSFINQLPLLDDPAVRADEISFTGFDLMGFSRDKKLDQIEAQEIQDNWRIPHNRSNVYARNPKDPVHDFQNQAKDWLNSSNTLMVNWIYEAHANIIQFVTGNPAFQAIYTDEMTDRKFTHGASADGRYDYNFYRHNEVEDLARKIAEDGPGIVCVEAVNSVLGTQAPLPQIVATCKENDCILLVDETNAVGFYGKEGGGLVSELGLEKDVHYRTAGFMEAFGTEGAIMGMNADYGDAVDIMPYMCYVMVFSLAPQGWQARRMNDIMANIRDPKTRKPLVDDIRSKTATFRDKCLELGYTGHYIQNTKDHIIPFVIGDISRGQDVHRKLADAHIFPTPYVVQNNYILTFPVSARLTEQQLERTLDFLDTQRDALRPQDWADCGRRVF